MIGFVFVYLLCVLMRVSMVAFGPVIAEELSFAPSQMGLIAASYPFGLFLALFPSYFLIRKWGNKQVLILSLFIMSFGMAMYGLSSSQLSLFIGRFLIGISHAAIFFIGIQMVIKKQQENSYGSLSLALGALGGILGSWPTFELIANYGWRSSCLIYAFCGLILLGLMLIMLKEKKGGAKESIPSYLSKLKEVFHSRIFWQVSLFPSAIFGGYITFQTYWIAPYLINGLKFSTGAALFMATALNIGALAALLFGGSLGKIQKKIAHPFMTQGGCLLALALLYFISTSQEKMGWGVWAVYGFFAQFAFLSYIYFKKRGASTQYHHICIASLALTFLFAALFQGVTSFIVETNPSSYRFAFDLICLSSLAMLLIAGLLALTAPKQKAPPRQKTPQRPKRKAKAKKRVLIRTR